MTVAEAVRAALDEWAKNPNTTVGEHIDFLEDRLHDAVEEWCLNNGYEFNLDTLEWRKLP